MKWVRVVMVAEMGVATCDFSNDDLFTSKGDML